MNASIETGKRSILNTWQFKFFAGSVVVLLAVLVKAFVITPKLFNSFTSFNGWMDWLTNVGPYSAGYVTVHNGINEFSGISLSSVGIKAYAGTFISILFTFVLAPTFFFFVRNTLRSISADEQGTRFVFRVMTILAGGWCVVYAGFTMATFMATSWVFPNMKSENELSRYKNDVTNTMLELSYKLRQYYILPIEKGGGGNSFRNNGRLITFDDIEPQKRTTLGSIRIYRSDSDTILLVHFVGNKLSTQPWDDQTIDHVVEYEMTVTPANHILNKLH